MSVGPTPSPAPSNSPGAFLKRMIGSKTFWVGCLATAKGVYDLYAGNNSLGSGEMIAGLTSIGLRDALAKMIEQFAAFGLSLAPKAPGALTDEVTTILGILAKLGVIPSQPSPASNTAQATGAPR